MSLVSNDSSTSLLPGSRRLNGSSLRQSSTVPNLADSLETLERLLRDPCEIDADNEKRKARTTSIVEADLEFDYDFGGLSLKELAASQPPEDSSAVSRKAQTVEECRSPCLTLPGSSIADIG